MEDVLVCSSLRILKKIQAFVDMIQTHLVKTVQTSRCETLKQVQRCLPPPALLVCINVDAVVFFSLRSSATGMML
jgi:hypothetical protein